MIEAKVVADSVGPDGSRLTTIQATGHRFILAEMNTHRAINKNSASSRAIPFQKQLVKVLDNPAIPVEFPMEQKGMSGGAAVKEREVAEGIWLEGRDKAVNVAEDLAGLGVHKSVVNRLLEPFMEHTMVLTATAWGNFFAQRCTPKAQPEIRVMAEAIRDAMNASQPRSLQEGEWHLPYVSSEDWAALANLMSERLGIASLGMSMYPEMCKISAARVARVSYLTQEGKRDIEDDLRLYEETLAKFGHWSPMEQVATPWVDNRQSGVMDIGDDTVDFIDLSHLPKIGNLVGWRTLRVEEEASRKLVTYR